MSKKITAKYLFLDITRMCNQICTKYCVRGPMQNVVMTEAIIDKIFSDGCEYSFFQIVISGGEPSLEPELIKYIVRKIIDKKVWVQNFVIATNGLETSHITIDALKEMDEYISSLNIQFGTSGFLYLPVGITVQISDDDYHEKTYNKEVYKRYLENFGDDRVVLYNSPEDYKRLYKTENGVRAMGLASNNEVNTKIISLPALRVYSCSDNEYVLPDGILISANGNIIGGDGYSYDIIDQYAIGNINQTDLYSVAEAGYKKIFDIKLQYHFSYLFSLIIEQIGGFSDLENILESIKKHFIINGEQVIHDGGYEIVRQRAKTPYVSKIITALGVFCFDDFLLANFDDPDVALLINREIIGKCEIGLADKDGRRVRKDDNKYFKVSNEDIIEYIKKIPIDKNCSVILSPSKRKNSNDIIPFDIAKKKFEDIINLYFEDIKKNEKLLSFGLTPQ